MPNLVALAVFCPAPISDSKQSRIQEGIRDFGRVLEPVSYSLSVCVCVRVCVCVCGEPKLQRDLSFRS